MKLFQEQEEFKECYFHPQLHSNELGNLKIKKNCNSINESQIP